MGVRWTQIFYNTNFCNKTIYSGSDFLSAVIHAIDQGVSSLISTTAARLRSQVKSCGICGGQSGARVGFFQVLRLPLPIPTPPTARYSSSIQISSLNKLYKTEVQLWESRLLMWVFFISRVGLSPLGTAAISGLLYKPQMIAEGDCGAIGGMKIGRGNRSTRRKPTPAPLCPPQNPTWPDPSSNPGPPRWEASDLPLELWRGPMWQFTIMWMQRKHLESH
jgi:hypothetical protein